MASDIHDLAVSLDEGDPLNSVNYTSLISSLSQTKLILKDNDEPENNFRKHTNRISGAVLGNDGSLLDFMGLNSVASSYNSMREAIKTEGETTKDYYSPIFSSILGSGESMMGDLLNTLSSATGGTASINPAINEVGIPGAQDSVNNLTQVTTRIAGTEGDLQ